MQDTEMTWADKLREEAKRETLKRLLSVKYGPLPSAVASRIDAIHPAEALDHYIERVLTASSLEELGLEG